MLMALGVLAWSAFLGVEKHWGLRAKHVPVVSLTILALCTFIPWAVRWLCGSHELSSPTPVNESLIHRSHALYAANMVALALLAVAYCRWLSVNRWMWRCYCEPVADGAGVSGPSPA